MLLFVTLSSITQASILDDINATGNLSVKLQVYYDFNHSGMTVLDRWPAPVGGNNFPKRFNLTARGTTTPMIGADCNGIIGDCAIFHHQSGDDWINNSGVNYGIDLAGTSHTVSFWLRHDNSSADQESYFYTYPSTNEWKILYRNSGSGYGSGGDVDILGPNGNSFNNEWIHIVLTDDGSTQKLYINGSLRASAGSMTDTIRTIQFCVTGKSSYSEQCSASMDEIAIWNRSLSATEVNALHELYVNYTAGGSAPLLLSPISDMTLNYSYTSPQTISVDLSSHFSGYTNYTVRFTNRTGTYTGLNSISGNTIEEEVINYSGAYYYFTLFFDADKNVSYYQIPTLSRSVQDIDSVYELNFTACNSFGCTTDLINLTLASIYSRLQSPTQIANLTQKSIDKNVIDTYNYSQNFVAYENLSIQTGFNASDVKIIDTGVVGLVCKLVNFLVGPITICVDWSAYPNGLYGDAQLTINAENISSNGEEKVNITLCNEGSTCTTVNQTFIFAGLGMPHPVITTSLPDLNHNLFINPTKQYKLNLTSNLYNFSQFRVEIINATNSLVNLSQGNYTDNYISIYQQPNTNQTEINITNPLSNFSVDFRIFVNSSNGTVSDNFTLTVINSSAIPDLKLSIPEIINITTDNNYQLNITTHYENYTTAQLCFKNPLISVTTCLNTTDNRNFIQFNLTLVDNETIQINRYFVDYLFNLNLTLTNNGSIVDSFYFNISGNTDLPTQLADLPNLEGCINISNDINFSHYFTNYDTLNFTFEHPTNSSETKLTIDTTNTSIFEYTPSWLIFKIVKSVVDPFRFSFLWTDTTDGDGDTLYDTQVNVRVDACNENGCINDTFEVQLPPTSECDEFTGASGIFADFFSGIFSTLTAGFSSIFPDADTLTAGQRYAYVFMVMFLTTLIIFILGFILAGKDFFIVPLILAGIMDFALFLYFVGIGYISVGVLIVIGLLTIAATYLKLRSGSGGV